MKYIYFDASAGLSGDMILGALMDLGVSRSFFKEKMTELKLPVEIQVRETKRASLRGLKIDVKVRAKKSHSRKWSDIEIFLNSSPFSPAVKKNSLAIFKRLFQAEARVHGHKFQEAHLHEAGADDAIVDITGTCLLLEALNVHEVYCSPLNVGQGWIKSSHGILPVPPPAVAELLKNIPVYTAWATEELVTPTGAAIVSTLVKKFIPLPELSYERVGCGAGKRKFQDFPNILRAFYGDMVKFKKDRQIFLIEANIDDSNPQVLAAFFDEAFKRGALDVFLTPILMKKNRLATKLTIISEVDKIDSLISAIFTETSSIGVRYFPVERRVLERETQRIKILGEDISVKISYFDGGEVTVQPEFSDCLKLAKKKRLPVKQVIQLAQTEWNKKNKNR